MISAITIGSKGDLLNILSIGGSDPSSGAGIQSDIIAAQTLGVNCFSVITAITAQNSKKFSYAESVSSKAVEKQLDSILSDFDIKAITVGMVYDSKIIKTLHSRLKNVKIPIILDPVIRSTTRGILLKKNSISELKKFLIPICNTITPNVLEAEILTGVKIRNYEDLFIVSKILSEIGSKNIIVTGHSFKKNTISDFIFSNGQHQSLSGRIFKGQNHGSGCNFAFAIAYCLAQKMDIFDSARFAKQFTIDSIKQAKRLGHGVKITRPKRDKIKSELSSAISQFTDLKKIYSFIPECQTNFVYAKPNPKSTNDIVGIMGRIVKTGKSVTPVGILEYGGSKHVATAVLTIQKKFPEIRSALNIKYDDGIVRRFLQAGAKISSYDRSYEPKSSKEKENSSISWGINHAIKNSPTSPDIIYHMGDLGKESMIIVFGTTPQNVIKRISSIL